MFNYDSRPGSVAADGMLRHSQNRMTSSIESKSSATRQNYQRVNKQRSIDQENMRLFNMIQNADSSIKR